MFRAREIHCKGFNVEGKSTAWITCARKNTVFRVQLKNNLWAFKSMRENNQKLNKLLRILYEHIDVMFCTGAGNTMCVIRAREEYTADQQTYSA